MPSPHVQVLPWHQPLPAAAAARLAGDWTGDSALDLSDTLVVVPTRQAGRRLREALAQRAADRGQGVFPPRVLPPEQVLDLAAPAAAGRPAPRPAQWLAWVEVFQNADLDACRAVFPLDPPQRNFAWALQLAEEMTRLQEALGEGGLRFGDVNARLGDSWPEAERWSQLADLEAASDAALAARGYRAGAAVHRETAASPAAPPPELRRIVLVATTDPRPRVLEVLEKWIHQLTVEVWIYADPGEVGRFDDWGRPVPAAWTEAAVALPDFEQRVHLVTDPDAQADLVARWRQSYVGAPGRVGLGCADAELVPRLARALSSRGLPPYVPQGETWQGHPLVGLLDALLAMVRDDGWEPVAQLARQVMVLDWLDRQEPGFRAGAWLAALDRLHAEHLPPTLAAALGHAPGGVVRSGLQRIAHMGEALRSGAFPDAWAAALRELVAGRWLETTRPEDEALAEVAEVWQRTASEVAALLPPAVTAADAAQVTLRLVAAERRFADKPAGAVDIDGWLELLFRSEPHLIVAGMNDGAVPEAISGHAFLPESLRERLGLKTNAHRLARDAWQLAALAASRGPAGRLDLVLGRTSRAGDPIRPSRLLFLCPDGDLPARVAHLFRDLPPPTNLAPWQRAWVLRPSPQSPPTRLRVTAFRDYLACPFRFYLKHVLRLEAVEVDKRELDARDFGGLVHRVLERLGRDPAWQDCRDARDLGDAFVTELDRQVGSRYGTELSLPLLVQVESARQRLRHAAQLQAAERAEGWVIEHVEWPFPDGRLVAGGLPLRGTIDRIERHAETGQWRVLDYKTAESAVAPVDAHLRRIRPTDPAEFPLASMLVTIDGRPRVWKDLQLPLYHWAVREALGADEVALGYFNLPKAVGETAITLWPEFDADLQRAARDCAESVAEAVAAGRFWPPVEDVRYDDFAGLIHQGAAASFAEPEVRV